MFLWQMLDLFEWMLWEKGYCQLIKGIQLRKEFVFIVGIESLDLQE